MNTLALKTVVRIPSQTNRVAINSTFRPVWRDYQKPAPIRYFKGPFQGTFLARDEGSIRSASVAIYARVSTHDHRLCRCRSKRCVNMPFAEDARSLRK